MRRQHQNANNVHSAKMNIQNIITKSSKCYFTKR